MAKSKTADGAPKKTECPISSVDFLAKAQGLVVKAGDQTKVLEPRKFSSGSFGWYCSEKITVMVDGVPLKCQANLSLIVVGSKPSKE